MDTLYGVGMSTADPMLAMNHAVLCLALEVDETIHADVKARWLAVVAEVESLRALIRVAVEMELIDEFGFHDNRGWSQSLLPGEWDGVIARAQMSGS